MVNKWLLELCIISWTLSCLWKIFVFRVLNECCSMHWKFSLEEMHNVLGLEVIKAGAQLKR